MKTQVAEFITSMRDGGAETLVKDYMLLMDKTQFDVYAAICFYDGDSANLRRLREKGISVISLDPGRNLFYRVWRRLNQPHYYGYRFWKLTKEKNITVVHAHLGVLDYLTRVSHRMKGIRLFHTCHAPVETIYLDRELPAARKLIDENGMQIIGLHKDMADEINELFSVNNTQVIRNGIDMQRFLDPGVTKAQKRQELGIPQEAFVLGHVGRFSGVKNHEFLVEVFGEVAAKREDAYLVMVGADDASHIEKRLHDLGLGNRYKILADRADVNEILAAMDAFAFPSKYEGLGIALIEAQAAGLRCVASDRVPAEAVRTEQCFALPLENPARWAELILDSSVREEGIQDLQVYDMNREIKRLEALYLGKNYG